jgi:gliding motility-associated-like protein
LKKLFLIIVFFFFAFNLKAQLSKVHYIPPLTANDDPGDQWMYISTPSITPVKFEVKIGGVLGATNDSGTVFASGEVDKNNPIAIELAQNPGDDNGWWGNLFVQQSETEQILNKGFIVEAESEVYVSARANSDGEQYQAGAIVSKGKSGLGTRFRAGMFQNQNTGHIGFISVMASEDLTKVSFNFTKIVETIGGPKVIDSPLIIDLNKGESYVLASRGTGIGEDFSGNELIGTLVSSTKPIVVNTGSASGSFETETGGQDYGMDQIVGSDLVGSEYIFIRGNGNDGWENVLIIADQNNTEILVNGESYGTLAKAGDYFIIEGNQFSSQSAGGNMYVSSANLDHKLFAFQGTGSVYEAFPSAAAANQGMFFVPPLNCSSKGDVDNIAFIDKVGNKTFEGAVSFITKKNATILINGNSIENFSEVTGPLEVSGNKNYVTYMVKELTGNIAVTGSDELYVAYFNYSGAATTGGFYSGFASPPEVIYDVELEVLGSCIKQNGESNIILTASKIENFDSIRWLIENESGDFVPNGNTDLIFKPTIAGSYKLEGVLECSNLNFLSNKIVVSICPIDSDQDGIIDNIDIDSDNDGISNNIESFGNASIDLSNEESPSVKFEVDDSINTAILENGGVITSIPSDLNTFEGSENGVFKSTVLAGTDVQLNYTLTFKEKLNIKLSDNPEESVDNNEDIFSIKVFPVTQNITLLDPSDNLLIDTNFDENFESAVTNHTSNEIIFKQNSSIADNPIDYVFVASEITGISITQKRTNTTTDGIFSGVISIQNYSIDTDNDNIVDYLDLDSDEDGCNDVIEGGFLDQDNNGMIGIGIPTTENDGVDNKGGITGHDYEILPLKDNNGVYLFQKVSSPIVINSVPVSTTACQVGVSTSFSVGIETLDNPSFIWQIYNSDSTNFEPWDNLSENESYSGVNTSTLNVNNVNINMNGNKYRVLVNSDQYLCSTISQEVELTVFEKLPVSNPASSIVICDDSSVGDDTDGLISSFDLASQTADILGSDQSTDDFTVSYHLSQVDADDTTNTGLSSPYTNSAAGGEKIFVRVLNNTTGCYRATTSFDLIVAPLPVIVNSVISIEQCDDDDDNDGVSIHNLTESQLLISSDYQNETFEYYTDADFNIGSLIVDPTAFENDPFSDSVYVKIITVNNCYRTSQIDITVAASQISKTFMPDNDTFYAVCDDSPALTQDGLATFSSTILQEVKQKLIASNAKFSAQNIRVTLHTNSDDGLSGENPINTDIDFTNTTATTQPIWARIVNIDISTFECLGYEQVATLYVEPKPIANAVAIAQQCDGDGALDLNSQDGKFPFDTSSIQSTLVGTQTNVTTYYYLADGTLIGNELPNPFLSTSQTIDIKIELDTALSSVTNTDGVCYDTTTLEFVVNDSPEAYPVAIAAHCDDGTDDKDGYSKFDTSTILNTLLTNPSTGITQSLADYTVSFSYLDDKGIRQTTATLPNPFNTKTQTVTASVTNPLNLDCIITESIEFVINPLPLFERIDDTTIVCLNLDPIPIGVTSSDSRIYSYTWTRNGDPYPVNIAGVDSSILIGLGGEYEVTAKTTDGTNCIRSLKINITESIIATVERKDIVVTDLKTGPNNTITVLTTTLGIGDYEYALDEIAGPYQDETLFEKIRPGIHTIYIRDKNDCGIAKIDVSVIGYKKFFTPNGDGIHDTWKVLGIRKDFQPESRVYIFDRYGKLIKTLDPLSEGWDGTYNGKSMPATDYWFRVFLEDGREFKSHFSLIKDW